MFGQTQTTVGNTACSLSVTPNLGRYETSCMFLQLGKPVTAGRTNCSVNGALSWLNWHTKVKTKIWLRYFVNMAHY